MEGEVAISGHFFNVMVPGFHNHLNLPSSFCEKLKDENSKRAILKSRIGKWKIDVCRNGEGIIRFENGWPQFVRDHGLSIEDFVVFEHTGDFHFNISIFDHTACEKEFPVESKKEHQENSKRESDKANVTFYHTRNPHFFLTMKPSFALKTPGVHIPVEFVRSVNLSQKSSITLMDPQGREWPVKLRLQTKSRLRARMYSGWHDFYVSNELKNGDVCVFELNSTSPRCTTALFNVQISRATV
ncbi:hypothetical protein ABFS82_04G144600 [Erythranthe guttata]